MDCFINSHTAEDRNNARNEQTLVDKASANLFVFNMLKQLGIKRLVDSSRDLFNRLSEKDLALLYAEPIWADPGKCK